MKYLVIFFVSSVVSTLSFAQNSKLIACHVSSSSIQAEFHLDAVGAAYLKFQSKSENQVFVCGLRVFYFSDGRNNVSPGISVDFRRGECVPALPATKEKMFLHSMRLLINRLNPEEPTARLLWLKDQEADTCILDRLQIEELHEKSDKWRLHSWGRRSFSDPRKAN